MRIIRPSAHIVGPVDGEAMLKRIEMAGRICYKSEDRITAASAGEFIRARIKDGHETIIEHESVSVLFICDRGVSHEIVRHRLASYSQESTRYCNYGKAGEIVVVEPPGLDGFSRDEWIDAVTIAERRYMQMIGRGISPQIARSVLPTCLKTELRMTANLREWRHFFKLRTSPRAHPQMRELTIPLLTEFKGSIPVVFEDICA